MKRIVLAITAFVIGAALGVQGQTCGGGNCATRSAKSGWDCAVGCCAETNTGGCGISTCIQTECAVPTGQPASCVADHIISCSIIGCNLKPGCPNQCYPN